MFCHPISRALGTAVVPALILLSAVVGCTPTNEPITQPQMMPAPSPFEYPVPLWDQRVSGETMLLVHVTIEGKVDSTTIFNGSGYAAFDSAAVAGARKLRFVAGKKGERPVSMWTKLPVKFSLDNTDAGALGTGSGKERRQ